MGTLKIYSPATGEYLGEAIIQTDAEVKMAVCQARLAQPSWKEAGFEGRSRIILKVRDLILSQMDELAELISKENGKPIIEAISHDIMPVMELMTYFAKHAEKLLRGEKICLGKWSFLGHESFIEYEPYGVVGIISPWNFPFSTPMGGIVMALMAGNTVVLKPSEITPLIGLKIGELFGGLPKNVLHVITGDGATGASLVNSGVNKIIFTGSVPTGKKIAEAAAKTLTPVTLELGGKDPFIVLPDADLEMASTACVWGAFCNSGQVCASVERVYVPKNMEEPFTKLVVEKTK